MKKHSTNALQILAKLSEGDAAHAAELATEIENRRIASELLELRTKAGLTQAQLAKRIGTTQSAIARLESADYEGHSLSLLRRIADALDCNVRVNFVRKRKRASVSALA